MGFYKYLRQTFGDNYAKSVKDSTQILRRSSCVIAFYLTSDDITECEVVRIMTCLLRPDGHTCLQKYLQHLSTLGYQPMTLLNTIDYVRHVLTWANRTVPECSKGTCSLSSFRLYASDISTKVIPFRFLIEVIFQ